MVPHGVGPLFANDPSSAERGAAVALGLDYYVDGLESGALVVGILNGELDIASTIIEAHGPRIVVGRDCRLTSDSLRDFLIDGLVDRPNP